MKHLKNFFRGFWESKISTIFLIFAIIFTIVFFRTDNEANFTALFGLYALHLFFVINEKRKFFDRLKLTFSKHSDAFQLITNKFTTANIPWYMKTFATVSKRNWFDWLVIIIIFLGALLVLFLIAHNFATHEVNEMFGI